MPLITPAWAQTVPQISTVPNFWDPKGVQDRPGSVPDKIQFLAADGHPPFVFRDADGRLTGFNVDLARALCEVLESSCALRIKDFEVLIQALEEEEGDAVISGLARSPELASRIAFTEDYLKLPARFVVRAEPAPTLDLRKLDGVRLSVEAGSRHEAFARRFWPEADLFTFESAALARHALKDNTADAHFGDGLSLSFWIRGAASEGCCGFTGGPWLEPGYFSEGYSIAVRKDDRERLEALSYALKQVHLSGIYRELYLRYFPLSFY